MFDCNRWSSTSSDKPAVKARRQCSAPLIFQILPSLQLQHSDLHTTLFQSSFRRLTIWHKMIGNKRHPVMSSPELPHLSRPDLPHRIPQSQRFPRSAPAGCTAVWSSPAGGKQLQTNKSQQKASAGSHRLRGVVCIITLATYCCWSKNDLELTSTVL
ncbi:hypothetical protein AALO_G00300420 [Alosa alosa]|uniref:Uncharacterized protein n=1 Tax=Alosa alosa TaxID=278164 RepID=A0AAV6FEC5_9TELE|nr:hypothetical protein AALO_G00300420 [Alosa alosa]